jgi:hypothetical protein
VRDLIERRIALNNSSKSERRGIDIHGLD